MKSNVVEMKNVSFSYKTPRKEEYFKNFKLPIKKVSSFDKKVLDNISLNLEENKITALLGRNGSGKTTLIKLIAGIRTPQSGSITVFGKRPEEIQTHLGVCLGYSLIYHRLTARENLEYFAGLYGIENPQRRIEELTEMLELKDVMDDIVESFSWGMKMKLSVARSLINNPKFLILDEPTLGIDLHLAVELRKFIRNLRCTVLLTTHYMEEAQELADNLCVIDQGKIHVSGALEEVLSNYSVNSVSEVFLQATGT